MFGSRLQQGGTSGGSTSFAELVNSATYSANSETTAGNITLPSSIVAARLLVMVLTSCRGVNLLGGSLIADWTEVANQFGTAAVYVKKATGSEGATVGYTSSTAQRLIAITHQISGWYGDIASGVDADSAESADPPSLSPPWGSGKTLWVGGVSHRRTLATPSVTAAPSSPAAFGDFLEVQSSTASSATVYGGVASALLQLETGTLDANAFTFDAAAPATERRAVMVAVRGL